jgi:type IV pilus assembly protein PilV
MNGMITKEHGFTLLEVLVSMTILTIGLLAVATMQLSSSAMDGRSLGMTVAGTLADSKMEELLGRPYTSAVTHPDLLDDSLVPGGAGHPPETQDEYTLTWSVKDNGTVGGVKDIRIVVTWNENVQATLFGRAKRYQIDRFKARE